MITEVCRLVVTKSAKNFAHVQFLVGILNRKLGACADSCQIFVITNLQTSVHMLLIQDSQSSLRHSGLYIHAVELLDYHYSSVCKHS